MLSRRNGQDTKALDSHGGSNESERERMCGVLDVVKRRKRSARPEAEQWSQVVNSQPVRWQSRKKVAEHFVWMMVLCS